jgi:hypothetical protein
MLCVFRWEILPKERVELDMGCRSGRRAHFVGNACRCLEDGSIL